MRILVVDDSEDLAANINEFLSARGHVVDSALDGFAGLQQGRANAYDAIVLDLMLPGIDGLALCQKLRDQVGTRAPILMLTARDTRDDRAAGLSCGADDYLIKPFSLRELDTRLTALSRRERQGLQAPLRVGELSLEPASGRVQRGEACLTLSPPLPRLLAVLMQASPRLVSRHQLEATLGDDRASTAQTLDTHIRALGAAIDTPFDRAMLETLPKRGYRLIDPNAS